MFECSTEDAIEGCRSTEDESVYFNLRRQIIRRGSGGKTVEGAVGRSATYIYLYLYLRRHSPGAG